MFHSDFLPMLKNNLRLCQILKCVPFEFDSKTGRLIKAKSFGHILLFRVQCVLSVMYIAALFLNLCFGPLTTTAKFQGFTFFMVYFVASWMKFNYSLDMAGTQVIHTFLDFEKYILKDTPTFELSLGAKIMKLFIQVAEISGFSFVILQLILLQCVPCTAPFIFSMFPNCGEMADKTSWMLMLAVHIFETWMCLQMIFGCTVYIFYLLCAGIICILFYFRIIENKISTLQSDQDTKKCINLYRCIQILEKFFNAYPMNKVIPVMVFGIPTMEIISLFISINFYDKIAMPGFLLFPLLGLNTPLNNICVLTMASLVHNSSDKILGVLKKKIMGLTCHSGRKRSIINRELRACSVLKVKFGSNYIDRGTPLVIQNFCLNQTMSLTLVKANKMAG
ncbi:hypothetical protein Fcan01_25764 [Folsomia candida]|nr:hypothetical protein Fcan01_25764 [Folsomia candida]